MAVRVAILDKMIKENLWEERILQRDQNEVRDWDVRGLDKPTQAEEKQVYSLWDENELGTVYLKNIKKSSVPGVKWM